LQRKLPAECGVDVLAIHPGLIGSRAIRGVWKWFEWLVRDVFSKFMILEPTEGARGVLFVATSDEARAHAREIRRRNSTDGPYFGSLGQAMHVARQVCILFLFLLKVH
jgi:NAD(P)-dependent dehydrogenase (short-subunit alcohol dehydrogenase family)